MVYVEMGFESSPWPEIEISLAINLAHHKWKYDMQIQTRKEDGKEGLSKMAVK